MSRDTSRKEAAGIVLFFVAVAIILIFYLPVALTGIIGSAVKSFFLGLIGVAAYAIPVYILYVALDVFFEKRQGVSGIRVRSIILLLVSVSALLALITMDMSHFEGLCLNQDGKTSALKALSLLWESGVDGSLIKNPSAGSIVLPGGIVGGSIAVALFEVTDESGAKVSDYHYTIYDADKNEIEADSLSSLSYGTYYYKIQKDGYLVARDSFYIGSSSGKTEGKIVIPVVLKAAGEKSWNGTLAEEPKKDEEGTYLIGTGAELAWFANEVNAGEKKSTSVLNAKLVADIDLAGNDWIKIGYYHSSSDYVAYGGSFQGDGHVIRHLFIEHRTETTSAFYDGLFAYTKGAHIENLTVEGSVLAYSTKAVANAYVGGIVGWMADTTLSNVTGKVHVETIRSSGNNQYTGGIAGSITGTSSLEKVTNYGSVKGYNMTGGIAGYTSGTLSSTGLLNEGEISGNSTLGGIFGNMASSGEGNDLVNKGELRGGSIVGGIAGTHSGKGECYELINYGSISGGGTLGGIEGSHSGAGAIVGAQNFGNLTGTGNNIGGILGTVSAAVQIEEIINDGTVEGASYVGGLIGMSSQKVSVSKGLNTNSVTALDYVGGITGYSYGTNGSNYRNLVFMLEMR